jgi:hypothetical protein
MMHRPGEPLTPLAADLVAVIGCSDRFTLLAAQLLEEGLRSIGRAALEQEALAGLGEQLASAYYRALVLLAARPGLLMAVTELLLRYRFVCALEAVYDHRAQAFWLRHGLDREIEESRALHATARLLAAEEVEQLCFGRQLAAYFGMDSESCAEPLQPATTFVGLECLLGDLWHLRPDDQQPPPGRHAYVLVPQSHIAITCTSRLCRLVADVQPLLERLHPDLSPQAVICAPLGTRKVSMSKPGYHSCSTYFDGGKPVPFSLNRGLEPYLLLSLDPLLALSELRARPLCFAPLVDSLSSLAFRDPADYRLGEGAFQHRPVLSARRESVSLRGAESSATLLTPSSLPRCPVEGVLVRSQLAAFSLTPCHELADRYARLQGVSGHGPSGVMNQSVLATPQGLLSTWRYERNFDSWSGRSADVARHPSLNFLGWERPDSSRSDGRIELRVSPLVYSGYPSECKIEDLRLFAVDGTIYAIAALILSRSRYSAWLPEISVEAAANNTIDDMLVVQSLGRLDPERGVLAFERLPRLGLAADPQTTAPRLPRGFEKNWLIYHNEQKLLLFYSLQPWRVFQSDPSLRHWQLLCDQPLELPASIQGPLRNSAHPFRLHDAHGDCGLGLVVHRRRQHTYIYDQYLILLSADGLRPQRISREPILSVNSEALAVDPGFRKNPGVCYVSSVLVEADEVRLYFNLFDCRTCVLSVSMLDLLTLVKCEDAFVPLAP